MLKISQYPRNADGTAMDLEVGVLTDSTGNGGARLTQNPVGPDNAPIDAKGLVIVDSSGNPVPLTAQNVPDRATMAALNSNRGMALLVEAGREGTFVWDSSNLSAQVTADPQQAVYVPPASDVSGASGAWVRKFTGAMDAKWFGTKGDNVTNDNVALQAWLDSGGKLYLPDGAYYSADNLILRKQVVLEGQGYAIFSGTPGAVNYIDYPGPRIRFAAGKGFIVQYHTVETDVATVLLNPAAYRVQEGAFNSVIRNVAFLGAGAGVGATVTGFYCRAQVHLENVVVANFNGKGFDFSGSVDAPDGNSEYGVCDLSTLKFCQALSNASHGFHFRGRECNIIHLDTCNANLNGGWGFLNEASYQALHSVCHAASNTLGSYKTTSQIAQHVFVDCYVEGGAGEICHLGSYVDGSNTVVGGNLAFAAINNNECTLKPTVFTANAVHSGQMWFRNTADPPGAIADSSGVVYHHANEGTVVKGSTVGGSWDVSIKNKNDEKVLAFNTGTKTGNFYGSVFHSDYLMFNGSVGLPGFILDTTFGFMSGNTTYGLWLAGQSGTGGTNDVTITNRAGTVVACIPANTTIFKTVGQHQLLNGDIFFNDVGSAFPGFGGPGNARLQATAVGGLNLYGYGSSYDISINNRAGTTALRVPTNTTNVEIVGTISASNLSGTNTGDQFTNTTAARLLGRGSAAGAGAAQELTLAGGLAISGTALTAAGPLTPTSVASTGAVTSSGATSGVGYATGAGGAVTQLTSKSTGVTLNKASGQITMNNAALASAAVVTFTVTNSTVAATDTINLNLASGQATVGTYRYWIEKVAAGSFQVTVENRSAGSLSEALVFNFAVVKAVNA